MIAKAKYLIRRLQANYYAKKILYPFDENWFKDKRVVIVGGADSVLKEKKGNYIDDFDVVVRINKGVEVIESQKDYVGTKTDFLFHAFFDNKNEVGHSPITLELWEKENVKNLVYTNNHKCSKDGMYNFLNFIWKSKGKLKCTEVPQNLYKKNNNAIKPFWPTTGFIAINTVFNCKPKEIYITGITFFKTPHNTAYRKENIEEFQKMFKEKSGSHNPNAEYEFIKELYIKFPHIISVDKTLKEIIATN